MRLRLAIASLILGIVAQHGILAQNMKESRVFLNCVDSQWKSVHVGGKSSWDVSLMMEFQNHGRDPVILINPTRNYGTGLNEVSFFFSGYDSILGNSWEEKISRKIEPTQEQLDALKMLAPLFDEAKPSENVTILLAPGEKFRFADSVVIYDSDINRKPDTSATVRLEPKASRIQFTYEFSFLQSVDDPDFMEKLSRRWQKFGRLPYNANGIYSITSGILIPKL